MQPELAAELLKASHDAGIHTAVETRLHVPWKYIALTAPYIDLLFLADLKHVADGPFKQWTDGSARGCWKISGNCCRRGQNGDSRPADSGFNADEEHP